MEHDGDDAGLHEMRSRMSSHPDKASSRRDEVLPIAVGTSRGEENGSYPLVEAKSSSRMTRNCLKEGTEG